MYQKATRWLNLNKEVNMSVCKYCGCHLDSKDLDDDGQYICPQCGSKQWGR